MRGPGKVRILATSSSGHQVCPGMDWNDLQRTQSFTTGGAYCSAKLANVLFTRGLAKRLEKEGIVAHAMEPGVVLDSNFSNHADAAMQSYMSQQTHRAVSSDDAAKTLVWLATADEPGRSSGGYYAECKPTPPSAASQDEAAADRLWAQSEALISKG
jgi:NAD(P)-dependent dehydrogenase (short-subunit alcohol dehydrogenase family)